MALILAALAGFIASAAFHPLDFWPALFVGVGLLFHLNTSRGFSAWQRVGLNLVFGICFQVITLYWIGTYVGTIAWVALVLMQATFFIVLSFASSPLTFALGWVAFEFVLRRFPFGGFGWSRIGYALTESPLNYLYPRISIVGVAFLVVLITTSLVKNYKNQGKLIKSAASALSLLALLALIPVNIKETGIIKVALVQGGQTEKLDNTFENANSALAKHFRATKLISPDSVDLVIWPENVIMHDPTVRKSTKEFLNQEVSRINAPILVNANLVDGTNGTLLIGGPTAEGKIQSYSKRYLTPFGEFMPLRGLVERISDKAKLVSGYTPGAEPVLFKTQQGNFRTLICYELLSDKQARNEMSDSDFIVTQTNNATYFKTWQLEQELAIAQARSAETSRHSAYVSTTGVTSIIDEQGRITNSIPKYTNQVLIDKVETRSGITPATRFGSALEVLLLILWLPLTFLSRRKGY